MEIYIISNEIRSYSMARMEQSFPNKKSRLSQNLVKIATIITVFLFFQRRKLMAKLDVVNNPFMHIITFIAEISL